ncbi:hypothetical protein [Streptomyces bullii]|uniref:Uncharacterized protein n=1 Tax=Streptomyces bullii TaxID=349910 RepID=A0ABW0UJ73_9ACTN
MGHRTDQPPDQPTPLPGPSYVRQVLDCMADEMERLSNRRRLLTEVGLRRAFNVAVATQLHELPTAVADEASDKAAELLPDTGPIITHGEYATLLRQVAEAV